ncbi:hypothetical protein [Antrihabitans cavernicola]|uniref:C2H2-type domain-containing protein n=1 Tax=Antrihabitans cavernicola TaxID=2495913 RepID=A0A5A7S6Z8_9NOCA|nr:hypothetical protein [Spelaeibacter cavernicola]KAA0017022.1 hypothetical protein FOY51_25615 [Spelaeibacter cavernicola]
MYSQVAHVRPDAGNMWGGPGKSGMGHNDPPLQAGTLLYISAIHLGRNRHAWTTRDDGFDGNVGALMDRAMVGGGIEAVVNQCARRLVDRLRAVNISAIVDMLPTGVHGWPYWQDDLEQCRLRSGIYCGIAKIAFRLALLCQLVRWRAEKVPSFTRRTGRVSEMLLEERAIERFTLSCSGCGHSWVVNYDVLHVEDTRGHQSDYYFRNGLPSLNPNAPGAVICPNCARCHTQVKRVSRHVEPPDAVDADRPGRENS